MNEMLEDLLVKRATEGLTDAEVATLETLLAEHPGTDVEAFDGVVAELTAAARPAHRMPQSLRERVLASTVPASAPRRAHGAWWTAAACFALAVVGWWPRIVSTPVPQTPPSASQSREALLAAPGVVQVSLASAGGEAAAPLTGDVVFDPATQRGYLRFRGIPANDPRLAQYQLWIADGARAQPEPVDGGVFDVGTDATTGDVIIPFEAKLSVGAAAAFVVTIEQPGGVVVSRQERVLALGKVVAGA